MIRRCKSCTKSGYRIAKVDAKSGTWVYLTDLRHQPSSKLNVLADGYPEEGKLYQTVLKGASLANPLSHAKAMHKKSMVVNVDWGPVKLWDKNAMLREW